MLLKTLHSMQRSPLFKTAAFQWKNHFAQCVRKISFICPRKVINFSYLITGILQSIRAFIDIFMLLKMYKNSPERVWGIRIERFFWGSLINYNLGTWNCMMKYCKVISNITTHLKWVSLKKSQRNSRKLLRCQKAPLPNEKSCGGGYCTFQLDCLQKQSHWMINSPLKMIKVAFSGNKLQVEVKGNSLKTKCRFS